VSTILFVDDNEQNRYLMRTLLTASGYEALEAAHGAEALALARRTRPDLIIADILMPQMDGFAFCRECKRDEALRDIPFVFYTATYTDPRDEALAMQLGAARFIVKPVENDDFVAILREVLQAQQDGQLAAPSLPPEEEETTLYRLYNEALIRKLEDKMLDLEQVNHSLAEREASFRRLAENAQDLIYRYEFVPRRGFTYVSPAATAITGYTPEEHSTDPDLAYKLIHPDDRHLLEAMARDKTTPGQPITLRWMRKDGETIWTEQRNTPIFDDAGELVAIEGIARDVTKRVRAAEALQQERNRAQKYLDIAGVMFVALDAEGAVTLINQKGCEILGRSQEEVIGQNWFDNFIPAGGREHVRAVFGQLMAGEIELAEYYENAVLTRTGEERVIAWHNTVLWDEQGRPTGILSSGDDVTARKQVEGALRASEDKFRSLFNQSMEGIYLHDFEGCILDVNQVACSQSGYSREELLQRSVFDCHPDKPNTTNLPKSEILRQWSQWRPGQRMTLEAEHQRKDGTVYPVEVSTGVVRYGDKHLILAIVKDITERKQAEEALRESEIKFRTLVDQAPEALFLHDIDGRIVDVNQVTVERYGYTREQLLQMRTSDIDPDYVEREDRGAFWQALKNQKQMRFEARHRRQDGHIFPVEIHLSAIELGGAQRILALANDISERRRQQAEIMAAQVELQRLLTEAEQSRRALLSVVEDQKAAQEEIRKLNVELEARVRQRTAQLEAANRELEAFAYSVSHDLRAPLRAMDGFSAALLSHYGEQLDAQGQHYLERIQSASQRMGELINDLLDLSRVTRREMSRQRVNLSVLAREIAAELQAEGARRQVEFVIADGVTAHGDAHLLRLVLQNLLGNAWKFTGQREQARIEFGVLEEGEEKTDHLPIYYVRDNGVGFDMAYADKLFAPFQRLHGMHEFPGTGIGLVTVKRIVARHGGQIWTEAALERGATFYFTLGDE